MADYIDREKYCNEICRCDQNYCDKSSCPIWKAPREEVAPIIHAKWEYVPYYGIWYESGEPPEFVCSHCKDRSSNTHDYCPSCGAKMDAKENDNEFD